ncbi:YqaA family protein [Sodaliphilus pleomorphus]|jgi:membrane protein YqaA with SNARE-associated domain|uniref:DedA family protein n=1 Tax=Sodaliphilus pleomorphus TaxID=2606626 RepID=A0A6L5XAP6_9BACT|nr:VTT domain-containing protein [Sodaliphilus pleomorphus]MDD6687702.1 VTT domain-containing protein [Sodaliphilus pleomorphus]MDY6259422.1 VTT domain-containing protein [Bacteroidales bacterium]MSS16565.1 DedA family protein [Sodaliphilus pleomorphus]
MDAFVHFFVQWGYFGLFLGSFIAGSVIPLSSEAILVVCVGPLGLSPWWCLVAALLGNVAGGMTCYWMGHLGNIEWIERWAHVKKEKLEQAERWVERRGAWMAFFAFLPIIGSAITVALGFLRANAWGVTFFMAIGKMLRYAAVIWGTQAVAALL